MTTNLITPPTEEAIDIDNARDFLGIEGTDSDIRIDALIKSARIEFENSRGCAMISSTWEIVLNEFPCRDLRIPMLNEFPCRDLRIPMLISVTSIKYLDSAGVEKTLADTVYRYTAAGIDGGIGRVQLRYGQVWPTVYPERDSVKVRYLAGWATATAVPEPIKDGIRAFVAEQYDGTDRSAIYRNFWRSYGVEPV
jgi:uncharacterized phiE125 gp8 family phage protein